MGRKQKKTYVDLIIVGGEFEVKNKRGEPVKLKQPYCQASSLYQSITTSSCKTGNPNQPSWGEDCTFTLQDEYEEIQIEIYDKKSKAHKTERFFLGQVVISVNELSSNKITDLWLDIHPPPTFDPKHVTTGRLHIVLQKGRHFESMILSDYGYPQKEMPLRVNVGDLVLVHNTRLITHTVHLSTRSQWDHVAMIIKTKSDNQLLLFEATRDGVEAYLLNTAIRFYRQNAKIAIRRANITRDESFMEGMYKFVEEVNGRPYKQDWIQLVRAAYNANEEDDLTSLFCSQLIAAAYQRLGLLSDSVCSNNFVPSDFAGNFQGELQGAKMSPARKIPSIRKKDDISLKPQYSNGYTGPIDFNISDKIYNIKFTNTGTKRDAQMNLYTVYMLDVTTLEGWHWMLFKRFNDFVALDKELQKYFSNIPSLPRRYLVTKLDTQTIQKRRVALQYYFRSLIQSDAAKCSILYDFLADGRKGVTLQERKVKTKKKKKSIGDLVDDSVTSSTPKIKRKHRETVSGEGRPLSNSMSKAMIRKKKTKSSVRSASDVMAPPRRLKKKSSSSNIKSSPIATCTSNSSNLASSPPTSSEWTKVVSPGIPRNVHPNQFLRQARTSLPSITRTNGEENNSQSELLKDKRKSLVDINVMFANVPVKQSKEKDDDTNSFKSFAKNLQRTTSTRFYLKKYALNESDINDDVVEEETAKILDDSSESTENDVDGISINRLSDISSLDLKSLGIEDVDLSGFNLHDSMEDVTTPYDVDKLLNEFTA